MPYKIEGTTNTNADLVIIKESDWSVEKTMSITSSESYLAKPLVSGTKTVFAKRPGGEIESYGAIDAAYYLMSYSRSIGNSLVLNSATSDALTLTPSAGNRKTFTISMWVKRASIDTDNHLFSCYSDGSNYSSLVLEDATYHVLEFNNLIGGSYTTRFRTFDKLRDPTNWMHICIGVDTTQATEADRFNMEINGEEITNFHTSIYPSQNEDFWFNSATLHKVGAFNTTYSDHYVSEFIFIEGSKLSADNFGEFVGGVWIPKTSLSSLVYGTNGFYLDFSDSDNLGKDIANVGVRTFTNEYVTPHWAGVSQSNLNFADGNIADLVNGIAEGTNISYNNPVGAYILWDLGSGYTANLTGADLYYNGVPATSETWSFQYSDNGSDWTPAGSKSVNNSGWQGTSWSSVGSHRYWRMIVTAQENGYFFSEIRWYGSGSYYAGNDFITYKNPAQVEDTPTNNFATWNPLGELNGQTYSDGNRKVVHTLASTSEITLANMGMEAGKWYWELKVTTHDSHMHAGIQGYTDTQLTNMDGDLTGPDSIAWQSNNGDMDVDGVQVGPASTYTTGDILMFAYDADQGKFWAGKNGAWELSGNPSTGANPIDSNRTNMQIPAMSGWGATNTVEINFGNPTWSDTFNYSDDNSIGQFKYQPPTGFLSLCSSNTNLSVRDFLDKPSEAVYSNSRTGTVNTTETISDVEFDVSQGALVAVKVETDTASWQLSDTVRGANKQIFTDLTNAEGSNTDRIKSFTSTGFTVGNDLSVNNSGEQYYDWALREGSNYGFDIVTYTGDGNAGRTVNHSLGRVPTMMWVKNLTDVVGTIAYHSLCNANPATRYCWLNDHVTFLTATTPWNDTLPTTTQFTLGTGNATNGGTDSFVAYLFADIPGFCKAFAYTGNGDIEDGPYIPLGFRPNTIIVKSVSLTDYWFLWDAAMSTTNVADDTLFLDEAFGTNTAANREIDFLSQGFKVRGDLDGINKINNLFVGFAWAEQFGPFSNAR